MFVHDKISLFENAVEKNTYEIIGKKEQQISNSSI